ncbi:MAG: malate synthase G [Xanthomonadales bacterium]|nr:malate synthase G [Xanthomonadales bacterium]
MTRSKAMALKIRDNFRRFVETELLPGLDIDAAAFWQGFEHIVNKLTPENRALLAFRDKLQSLIDQYHDERKGMDWDADGYREFLEDIGYLEPAAEPFRIETENVDPEIAGVAGPQLVVPVSNARFALNAANARWGSLYDALYGTNVIPDDDGKEVGRSYNPARGAAVIETASQFLDDAFPLCNGRHHDVTEYVLSGESNSTALKVMLGNGSETGLADPGQFIAFNSDGERLSILLENNGLHAELVIDSDHPVGKDAPANVADVILESAITTIQDCEDSVAAVDAEDKVAVYRNWLGLMRGTLSATFTKSGKEQTRVLNHDRKYTGVNGKPLNLPGRSLMLVRNVGHLMTTDAVLDKNGKEVFEGMLDAVITTACALHDLKGNSALSNSRPGSIYIVKPKMHGSREVKFADHLFSEVEDLFGLDRNTIKIGVMDEERRTTVNLEQCIAAVSKRLVFINTGFLDRTGDEIHTSMLAGAMLPKEQIKEQPWINAYEDRNVDIGIRCGLPGRAQIGKGMWPKPDEMRQMMDSKQAHLEAGANCAWVPSPTAATLHAMHYHRVNVFDVQKQLSGRAEAGLDDILCPPFGDAWSLSPGQIQGELDNNAQGILGYVVRWIDQGVGCSKVPDIHDVGLMEDRATLRISSQHIANWLHHGVCSKQQVMDTFRRMAAVVDAQNAADPAYQDMAPDFDNSVTFRAACDLAILGGQQPNGYTEPLLHEYRKKRKEQLAGT